MRRKKYTPKPSLCSRLECPNNAITAVMQNGIRHKLCKECWLKHMDNQDHLTKAISNQPKSPDRKSLAAGSDE